MPMIDVNAPSDLFPIDVDRAIGQELTSAVLRAEGVRIISKERLQKSLMETGGSFREASWDDAVSRFSKKVGAWN